VLKASSVCGGSVAADMGALFGYGGLDDGRGVSHSATRPATG
jgi:hypothetical protein